MKYDSHFDYIAKGAIISSQIANEKLQIANWYEQGEKSNKYFSRLESYRGTKNSMRKMFTSEGTLTTNPKKIMKEIEHFYSDLYAGNEEGDRWNHPFLQRPEIPKLTYEMMWSVLIVLIIYMILVNFQTLKNKPLLS